MNVIIDKYENLKGVKLMRKNISGNSPWEDIVRIMQSEIPMNSQNIFLKI